LLTGLRSAYRRGVEMHNSDQKGEILILRARSLARLRRDSG
jgi:hypothetical protein